MVQRLGKGRYRVQIRIANKLEGGVFPDKALAEQKEAALKKVQAAIRAGMEAPDTGLLLYDYAGSWMRKRVDRGKLARGTTARDEERLRMYLLPRLGGLPLTHCTTKLLTELLDEIQSKPWTFESLDTRTRPRRKEDGPLSNATRNRIRALLHKLFHDAYMDGKITHNPVDRIPLESEKKQARPFADPLTQEETDKLQAAGYARGETEGFAVILFLYTGGRVSMIAGLQNRDFDLKLNQLHFRRIYEQDSRGIQERIKGHPEGITIPLFPRVREAFQRHIRATPHPEPAAFCLTRGDGRNLTTHMIRGLIRSLCRQAKIRVITPHVLRATFATLGEEAGLSKEDLQRLLGHSSVLVTQRYTRRKTGPLLQKAATLGFGNPEGEDE